MSTPPFILGRATKSDLPGIIHAMYRTFTQQFIHDAFMGPDTAENKVNLVKRHEKIIDEDGGEFWTKVTDTSSGKIVAAGNWKIYQSKAPLPVKESELPWLQGADPKRIEAANALLDGMVNMRAKHYDGPYIGRKFPVRLGYALLT